MTLLIDPVQTVGLAGSTTAVHTKSQDFKFSSLDRYTMSQSIGKIAAERNQRMLAELVAKPGNGKNPAVRNDSLDLLVKMFVRTVKHDIHDGLHTIWGYSSGSLRLTELTSCCFKS